MHLADGARVVELQARQVPGAHLPRAQHTGSSAAPVDKGAVDGLEWMVHRSWACKRARFQAPVCPEQHSAPSALSGAPAQTLRTT